MTTQTDTSTTTESSIIDNIQNLPSALNERINNNAERAAEAAAKKTADYLIESAQNNVNSLFKQKKIIEDSKSSLITLMQRYNIEKSRFTEIAEWYGQKTGIERAFLGLSFVAASALIGSIVNLAAVFSILALIIHYEVTTLLQEHYDITSVRDERFCADIKDLEARLTELNQHHQALERSLHTTLIELSKRNVETAIKTKQFEEHIDSLTEQIERMDQIVIALDNAKKLLIEENTRTTEQLQRRSDELNDANNKIIDQSTTLNNTQCQLGETTKQLSETTLELNILCEKFKTHEEDISELKERCQAQLDILEQRIAASSAPEKLELEKRVNAATANSDFIIKQVESQLASRASSANNESKHAKGLN